MHHTNEAEQETVVMPLTLCRSNGGPFDDAAFLSGWRLRELDLVLAGGVSALADAIRPIERDQADLIAMARGYAMVVEPSSEPAWLSVTFVRVEDG
jgi:hypothetical protein